MSNGMHQDGEQFGRYTLVKRLGVGGMAEVFLARRSGEAGFEKHFVIKKILPSLAADPEFVERLIREGKLVAGLSHGNIVQVHELDQQDGEFFLIMDYVAGTDLRELMGALRRAGEAFPETLAAHVLLQVARALAYAHAKEDVDGVPLGIVHRDISPANVLVSWEGEIKLTDFGIARVRQEGRVLTSAGMLRGKVPYMSPEQVCGETLGPESDVFSFGVLAYELLAGVRPFDGESDILTLDRIRSGERLPLGSLREDVDEALVDLVETCLDHDRSQRPSKGADLERALGGLMVAQGWVVSNADVSALLDRRFPKDSIERSRVPATGVTASGTASATTSPRDRIPTKSLVAPAPRLGAGRWIGMILVLLLAVGAVSFGLGLIVDWHRGGGTEEDGSAGGDSVMAEDVVEAIDTPASATAPDVVIDTVADAAEVAAPDVILDVAKKDTATAATTVVDTSSVTDVDAGEVKDTVTAKDVARDMAADKGDAVVPPPDALAKDVSPDDVPPEPPKAKPSVTRIDVIPREATIEVNGEVMGSGSHVLRLKPGGRARIRLSHPGHRAETFELRHPAPRKISKRLWAAPEGSLKIRYLPANAALFLDGEPVQAAGGLNIVVLKSLAGPHSLRLVGPDGREVTREVEVREGEQLGITLRIE